jgi:outer membrane protein insertion porin family
VPVYPAASPALQPAPNYAQPNYAQPPYAQPPMMPSAGATPAWNPGGPVAQPGPGIPPQPEFVPAPDPRYGVPVVGPPCPPPGTVPPPGQPPLPITEHLFGEKAPLFNPTPNGEPLQDLPLRILTDETQTGRLMFGVGVNSDAGVVGSIVLDEQNFDWTRFPRSWDDIRNGTAWRGAGQRFRIEAVPGTQVQRYMINFQEPYLLDSPVSLGLSGFYFDRIYTEWSENRLGGRVSLGYQITHDLTGSIAFRGMNVNIRNPITPTPPDLEKVLGNNALYGVGVTLAHDTRDNAFLATEGHLIELSFEQVFGSFRFPHTEIEISQYFKLYERPDGSGRHVLSLSGRAGVSGDNTPIFERYFAGGFSTLRGFRFRGVSPRVDNVAVGGDFQLLATAQYLFPITADDMLRGVVFCDSGTIEPTIKDWNQNYRVAPGFGLRIVIPAMGPAPIALDFAFPVLRQPGDQNEVFSFFVGFNR